MANNKTSWTFDLDIKDAMQKVSTLKDEVGKVGGSNFSGLINNLDKVAGFAAIIGVAYMGLKTSLDMVFEAEQIKALNQQFEVLTKNAGLAGDAILAGMEKAAGGLVDDTELIEAANKAIVKMGDSAKDLPKVMELARVATAAMGGDMMQNFEAINNAIATGRTMQLKQLGIIVDAKKAYDDYAKSIGTTAGLLNEAGKQQALMNAVLEKGGSAFSGVDVNVTKAKNTFTEILVTIGQIKEAIVIAFEKTFGPAVQKTLGYVNELAKGIKNYFEDSSGGWGNTVEQADRQLGELRKRMQEHVLKSIEIEEKLKSGDLNKHYEEFYKQQLKNINIEIDAVEAEMRGLAQKKKDLQSQSASPLDSKEDKSKYIDTDAAEKQRAAFEKSLADINIARIEAERETATTLEMVEYNHLEAKSALVQQYMAKEAEIKNNDMLLEQQKTDLLFQLELEKNARLEMFDKDLESKRMAALERYADKNKYVAEGFGASWKVETEKAILANKNFATMGSNVFNTVNKQAVAAFKAMGDGSKDAGEAMKGFIFQSLGEIASMKGQVMLAEGIGTYNPLQIAQGGVLIALGSLISSMGGGAGSMSAGAGGGGAGGGSGLTGSSPSDVAEEKPEVKEPKKAVNVQVMGSYFETEQTKTRLMELIRESSDATDFNFRQIGQ